MGGRPTPVVGFGLGIERTVLKIKEKNIPIKEDRDDIVFLAQLGDQARRKCLLLFEEMRKAGYEVRQSFTKDSLKAQLEDANRLKAKFSLVLGQKELMDGTIIIRDMDSGTQEVIDHKKIYSELDKRFKELAEKAEIVLTNPGTAVKPERNEDDLGDDFNIDAEGIDGELPKGELGGFSDDTNEEIK